MHFADGAKAPAFAQVRVIAQNLSLFVKNVCRSHERWERNSSFEVAKVLAMLSCIAKSLRP